jgi:hypothetical protein
MVLAKAFIVGIVTGLLAPVVTGVASVVWFLVTLLFGGYAMTGGGSYSINVQSFFLTISPESLFTQIVVGFAVGFLLMLWRALVRHETRVERLGRRRGR